MGGLGGEIWGRKRGKVGGGRSEGEGGSRGRNGPELEEPAGSTGEGVQEGLWQERGGGVREAWPGTQVTCRHHWGGGWGAICEG